MRKYDWTGNVALVIVFAFILPAPVLESLGVPGYRTVIIPCVAFAVAAALGVAQYVRMSRRERADLAEAHELRDHPRGRAELPR